MRQPAATTEFRIAVDIKTAPSFDELHELTELHFSCRSVIRRLSDTLRIQMRNTKPFDEPEIRRRFAEWGYVVITVICYKVV